MLTLELIIVDPDFRWTLDASIIGSNPGGTKNFSQKEKSTKTFYKEKKMPKNFSQIREEAKKISQKETKNFCSGVGLRPSSSDERIDSSMFVLEVFLFYFFLTGF